MVIKYNTKYLNSLFILRLNTICVPNKVFFQMKFSAAVETFQNVVFSFPSRIKTKHKQTLGIFCTLETEEVSQLC